MYPLSLQCYKGTYLVLCCQSVLSVSQFIMQLRWISNHIWFDLLFCRLKHYARRLRRYWWKKAMYRLNPFITFKHNIFFFFFSHLWFLRSLPVVVLFIILGKIGIFFGTRYSTVGCLQLEIYYLGSEIPVSV